MPPPLWGALYCPPHKFVLMQACRLLECSSGVFEVVFAPSAIGMLDFVFLGAGSGDPVIEVVERARKRRLTGGDSSAAELGNAVFWFVDACCRGHVQSPTSSGSWFAVLQEVFLPQCAGYLGGKMKAVGLLILSSRCVSDFVAAYLYSRVVAVHPAGGHRCVVLRNAANVFDEFRFDGGGLLHSVHTGAQVLCTFSGTFNPTEALVPANDFVVSHLVCKMVMRSSGGGVETLLNLAKLVDAYPWEPSASSDFFLGLCRFLCGADNGGLGGLRLSGIGPLRCVYDLDFQGAAELGTGSYGTVRTTADGRALKIYTPVGRHASTGIALHPEPGLYQWNQTLAGLQRKMPGLMVPVFGRYEYALVRMNKRWAVRLTLLMERCERVPAFVRASPAALRAAAWVLSTCRALAVHGFVAADLKIDNVAMCESTMCLIDLDGIETRASAPQLWECEGDMFWPTGTHTCAMPEQLLDAGEQARFISVMELGDSGKRWDLGVHQTYFAGYVTAAAVYFGMPSDVEFTFAKPDLRQRLAALQVGLPPLFAEPRSLLERWFDRVPAELRARKREFLAII